MDLPDLSTIAGSELSHAQINGILAQIDLDITNLLRDGKLSALKYGVPGPAGVSTDRAANLHALLAARDHYHKLLTSQPVWATSVAR
ncbi:MAG: hypothetical protein R3B90_05580 [Planctomycetaceae bacterium]